MTRTSTCNTTVLTIAACAVVLATWNVAVAADEEFILESTYRMVRAFGGCPPHGPVFIEHGGPGSWQEAAISNGEGCDGLTMQTIGEQDSVVESTQIGGYFHAASMVSEGFPQPIGNTVLDVRFSLASDCDVRIAGAMAGTSEVNGQSSGNSSISLCRCFGGCGGVNDIPIFERYGAMDSPGDPAYMMEFDEVVTLPAAEYHLRITTYTYFLFSFGSSDVSCSFSMHPVALSVCPVDANGDGIVNVADLIVVLSDWGCTGLCDGEVTGDAVVDVDDLLAVILAWGSCQ